MLRWKDVDEGIWEVRGGAGHFLYSKLMNWVALDRAVRLAASLGADDERVARWADHRDRIRAAILTEGWSDAVGAYTQAFGRDELDASVLMMPIVGFLPADDPRMRATIDAIAERLTDEHGFVFRYLNEDGLPGGEGTFGICTFWLAECLALAGEVDRATALLRSDGRLRERRRAARRGGRPGDRRAARQLPAGLHPHRADPRRARDRGRDHRAEQMSRFGPVTGHGVIRGVSLAMAEVGAGGGVACSRRGCRGRLHQIAFVLAVPAGRPAHRR